MLRAYMGNHRPMLLTVLRVQTWFKTLRSKVISPEIIPEVLVAYYQKLPSNIQVSWWRDGEYIVGNVVAGDISFPTQGTNVGDFIRMINEGLLISLNIPSEYIEVILSNGLFSPSLEELAKLSDDEVKKSNFGLLSLPANDLVAA